MLLSPILGIFPLFTFHKTKFSSDSLQSLKMLIFTAFTTKLKLFRNIVTVIL